ncbi:fructokinase [Fodinibius roseus]|uniref:Fructokinase n=1 Tax=Fodinibius roseus TaxID=1194090 RepID=A0A1M5H2B7_9BACT|nr:carbohydrate kinase [Fodinibius roseus]SHG10085.1 fructokinase [Fodinibius roseus]
MASTTKRNVLCVGEVLWDSLPGGLFLGGAPLNVCYHLNQLGIPADMCSRVGDDRLGKEALRRIQHSDISTAYIQTDSKAETGFVKVEIGERGDPAYEIIEPAAWDFIEERPALADIARESWALVFGSLAQRHRESRSAIRKLWGFDLKKILDINLRPPHIDSQVIRDSLKVADIIKLNEDELFRLIEWYSLNGDSRRAVEELAADFQCSLICVTAGTKGAVMYQNGSWYSHEGYPANVKDSVGAGDAFLAALVCGIQAEKKGEELLRYANAAGSFVARKDGATPEYTPGDIERLARGSRE